MYARTLAWYGATPEKSKHSRLEQIKGNHLQERNEDGSAVINQVDIQLPPIPEELGYLLGFFIASGQATSSGMGLVPLSWQELKAFREENELDITLFERELLKKMSEAYCAEYHAASDPRRPAPYTPEVEEDEIDHIGRALGFMEQLKLLRQNREN